MQLHRPDVVETLESLEAQILVISFAGLARLEHWIPYFRRKFLPAVWDRGTPNGVSSEEDAPFARTRFLSDPGREVYHAYGLGRLSPLTAGGPRILKQYLRWTLQGRPVHLTTEDVLQRGANFVVGRDGRLSFCHTGRDQSDRPSVDTILAALRYAN